MRNLLVGLVLGIAIATSASAFGFSTRQNVKLDPGDTAYINDVTRFGQPTCQSIVKQGIPTLSCFVESAGGELRKRFGVTISNSEVTVNRYFGPSSAKPYKVIFRRDQRSVFVAH
ncbi:MAG TPA: hypothetical protein VFJ78_01695 [Gaiellaceae bacterium]|nr:hypothetical protein [Gaiellaceae bacterium]